MKSFLILEDGTVFEGKNFGSQKEVVSEIVFNTSMAGYPEVLTDPSYAGQAVCMTYPLIGNYGVCTEDMESQRPWPDSLIVREACAVPSNFRSDMPLHTFLEKYDVPGIEGIDTRALTKLLREKGTMNGMITTDENYQMDEILPKLKAYTCGKVVAKVSCREKYLVSGSKSLSQNGPLSGHAVFD
ncbi:MAG TPA: carbamoyl phosphate synthase small subunit, partial [Lachnospiraceae bacterium]|nr:carbamoyl phosphate synthase small subunit [Lachnospiraceae bacterium]